MAIQVIFTFYTKVCFALLIHLGPGVKPQDDKKFLQNFFVINKQDFTGLPRFARNDKNVYPHRGISMGAEHKKLVRNKKTYGLSCVILGLDPRTQVIFPAFFFCFVYFFFVILGSSPRMTKKFLQIFVIRLKNFSPRHALHVAGRIPAWDVHK